MAGRLGRYEILKPIASGGMATVYLARALGAGGFERLVAVKSMHPHIAADPEFVAMFLDEARLAARLRHPNAVATIDVQEQPLFLVMEYVEGPSLHRVQREMRSLGGRLPLGVALRIFLDVVEGLNAAHELTGGDGALLHLVHRDVSPQNMLIGVDGVSRITDFGVARAEARLGSTRRNEIKGKLGYMAPEQVRSDPVDRRADIYAAGAVLWELLVGRPLVRGESEGALVAQVLAGPRSSPRQLDPAIPPGLDAACMRALQVDPAARFPTAAELAEAVEAAATEAGIAIATPRQVAAFVRELGVHEPAASAPTGVVELPAAAATEPACSSGVESTRVAVVHTDAPPPPRARRSIVPFAVTAAVMGIAAGVGAFALTSGEARSTTAPAPASEPAAAPLAGAAAETRSALPAPAPASSTRHGAPAGSAVAGPPAPEASFAPAEPPAASSAPSAGDAPPAGAGATDGRRVRPRAPTSGGARGPGRPGGAAPPASPTSFRPGDL